MSTKFAAQITKLLIIVGMSGLSPTLLKSQIPGLKYCGMSKSTGEYRCFSGLDRCRSFNIHGSCRAEKEYLEEGAAIWCLYQGKAVLWGCYSSQETCERRAQNLLKSRCFPLK